MSNPNPSRSPNENRLPVELKPLLRLPPPYKRDQRPVDLRPGTPLPGEDPVNYISFTDYISRMATNPDEYIGSLKNKDPLKKVVLTEIEKNEDIWLNYKFNEQRNHYYHVGHFTYKRTGQKIHVTAIINMFKQVKDLMRVKLKQSIIKMGHDPEQTETYMRKWQFYKYVRFFRPSMSKLEDKLRAEVQGRVIVIDDDEDEEIKSGRRFVELMETLAEDGLAPKKSRSKKEAEPELEPEPEPSDENDDEEPDFECISTGPLPAPMQLTNPKPQPASDLIIRTRQQLPMRRSAPYSIPIKTDGPGTSAYGEEYYDEEVEYGEEDYQNRTTYPEESGPLTYQNYQQFGTPPPFIDPNGELARHSDQRTDDLMMLFYSANKVCQRMTHEAYTRLKNTIYDVVHTIEEIPDAPLGDVLRLAADKADTVLKKQ